MHVGITIIHRVVDMDANFNEAASMGFRSYQLVTWSREHWTAENAEAVINTAKSSGVAISAVWCGWSGPTAWNFYDGHETLGLVPAAFRFQRMQDLMAGGDFALKLGVRKCDKPRGISP